MSIASIICCNANPGDSAMIASLKDDIKKLMSYIETKDTNGAIITERVNLLNKYDQMVYLLESAEKMVMDICIPSGKGQNVWEDELPWKKRENIVRLCVELISPVKNEIEYYSRKAMNTEELIGLIYDINYEAVDHRNLF